MKHVRLSKESEKLIKEIIAAMPHLSFSSAANMAISLGLPELKALTEKVKVRGKGK